MGGAAVVAAEGGPGESRDGAGEVLGAPWLLVLKLTGSLGSMDSGDPGESTSLSA